jgi:hypothetical protein
MVGIGPSGSCSRGIMPGRRQDDRKKLLRSTAITSANLAVFILSPLSL